MTGNILNNWLRDFNKRMRYRNRKIVLTMDNASCHKVLNVAPSVMHGMEVYQLSNITVVMLPKNTTAEVQPMDAGLIRTFKARYKQWLSETLFQMYEKVNFEGNLTKVRPNVGKCVIEAVKTWNMMPDGAIYNCFKHTGILPAAWHDFDVNEPVTAMSLLREAQVAIQYCTDNMSRALPEHIC